MRTPLSIWSRYVRGLFGTRRAMAPLRRADRRVRRRVRQPISAAAEVLELRQLLSGFTYADFSSTAGLNLVGNAAAVTNSNNQQVLRLTPALQASSDVGGAWVASKDLVAGNFSTTFQFQLATASGGGGGSDGFAFIIQNGSPTPLEGGGMNLGYNGMLDSIAVQFDTFQNSETSDPSSSYVGVHTGGTGPNGVNNPQYSLGYYNTLAHGFALNDGHVHTATISYTPGTLSIYLDGSTNPVLTVAVDLNMTLALDRGSAWVGFTGASGGTPMNQDILNWSFAGDDNIVVAEPASIVEPAAGSQSTMLFTLDRVGNTAGPLAVNWNTADGTAHAGTDYVAASGTALFGDGQSQQTVAVTIDGGTPSANETFKLILSPTPGVTVASGQGTIQNVDTTASIGNASVVEGDTAIRNIDSFVLAGSGGLNTPKDMVFGPNGDLFVASFATNSILRYDGSSGAFLGAFVAAGAGGLVSPQGLAFGPDGNLYVSSFNSSQVLCFDGTTGAYLDTFVTAGSGGLNTAAGIVFAPDGSLLVTSAKTNQILQYQGPAGASPGAFMGVFANTGANSNPIALKFGPDGNLYVSCAGYPGSNEPGFVSRYSGTGAFRGTLIPSGDGGLTSPRDVTFDAQGNVYVTDVSLNAVLEYQGPNGTNPGAFIGTYVSNGLGGLSAPIGMLFGADGNLYVSSRDTNQVLRYGVASQAAFTVTLAYASAVPVTVNYATANGSAVAGTDYVAASGTLLFGPGETTKTILVKTLSDGVAAGDKTFTVNLSNPSADVTLTNTQGTGTIRDGETKFRVVNAGSTGTMYNYGSTGASVGSSALAGADTTPRGMASNAAGTMTWTVDASKTVYVYNAAGALLGSWTAGGLKSTADIEGLATNGTDIWLLDAKSATVYRYTGAASRLSGSQNAASSFNLSSGNSNGKGIATDGTSFWVVNDGTSSDKVFKYSLAGALLGSWTIDAANAHPTGITINPNNVSDIWIVDSGTDKVYQYIGAATRTSGSQNAAASLALAAGDTNPQDIADPPPVGGTGTVSAGSAGGNLLPPDTVALAAMSPGFDRGSSDNGSADGADSHFAHLFGKTRSQFHWH